MSLLSVLSLSCGLLLHVSFGTSNSYPSIPRQTIFYQNKLKSFREVGIFNYSTMLIREDLGVLLLGAREAIYALDLNNISVKKSEVYWPVPDVKWNECIKKKKDVEVECRNYIRTLHNVNETTMYVCGTNAFSPTCDYLIFVDGQLRLKGEEETGKGKCPYDPFQRYSSLLVESDLYSATSMNFLGSEHVVKRNSVKSLRTVSNSNWLNEPSFIHMEFVGESFENQDGDDDKIYLFFSENAIEYDFTSKVVVSRVARVCKRDMGGSKMLTENWTTFLKALLDCPLSGASLPPIVQDVFLLNNDDWRKNTFYAVFTTPPSLSQTSLVCAYDMSAIRNVFSEGKFKTSIVFDTSHTKWVRYDKDVTVPRPGACINNEARNMNMHSSLDLPDKTIQFIKDHPLMDEAVKPVTGQPLLVTNGPLLTKIVVDYIMALDGQEYTVMFVGTANGYINKAVNYGGEMFIIEEIQLYKEPVPIRTMHLSKTKGQIYAGSEFGAVQMPLSNCSRHATCVDCVLAKDPYCAWDLATKQCSSVTAVSNTAVQSLKEGETTQCPQLDPVVAVNVVLVPGNNIQLLCQAHSNLAQIHWRHSGQTLGPIDKYYIHNWGLLIANASASDAGLYICDSVEKTTGRIYNKTMAAYQLQLPPVDRTSTTNTTTKTTTGSSSDRDGGDGVDESQSTGMTGYEVAVILLSVFCFFLIIVVIWTWSEGKLQCLKLTQSTGQSQVERQSVEYMHIQNRTSEKRRHRPQTVRPLNANTDHSADFRGNRGQPSTQVSNISTLNGLGYINDESEI